MTDTQLFAATAEGSLSANQWWRQKGSLNVADAISSTLSLMKRYHEQRVSTGVWNARLYGNLSLSTNFGVNFSELQTSQASAPSNRLTYNVIAECLETIVARVAARVKPRPYWVTSGGTYKERRRAKRLNKFSDGLMAEQNAHKLAIQCFTDAAVFGSGVGAVFIEQKRIKLERVIPSEIWVDEQESLHGTPRQMHRVKLIDRGTLGELFPKHRSAILRLDVANVDNVPTTQASTHELVEVRESWRLPDVRLPNNAKKAEREAWKPGRHVISISECTLLDEDWKFDWFPFCFIHYLEPLSGFWGRGLVEMLSDIQTHINKFLWVVSRALHLHGSTKILLHKRSNVPVSHITNNPSAIIEWNGEPGMQPQWLAPPAVPMEIYQQIETQINRAHTRAHISRLSTSGEKPPGLNAAVALREYLEIEKDAFATLSKQYEDFYVDMLRKGIELLAAGVEAGDLEPDYEVTLSGIRRGQVVDWESINFDRDIFVLRCFPTSSLPLEPAARQQTVTEWVQAGWADERDAKKLLDFPDLEMANSQAQAAEDYIEQCIDKIVDDGEYTCPDIEDDLTLATKLSSIEIQLMKSGLPDDEEEKDVYQEMQARIDLLRRFRDEAMRLMKPPAPPMPQGMPPPVDTVPPGGAPPQLANPMPLPQSPLIPQV